MLKSLRWIVILLLAAFCWHATTNTRLYVWNGDPIGYLHAAQTLRAGEGLRNYDFQEPFAQSIAGPANAPFTTWPPLYPIVLSLMGADLHAARVLNAVSLWATFLLIWALYGDYGVWWGVRVATCVAYLAMLVGDRQTLLSASSEALFYPLALLFLMTLTRVQERQWRAVVILIAVCLPMTRYIGVSFVAVGALYVACLWGWRTAALYSLSSLAALSLWALRNIALTGRFTGNTQPGAYASIPFLSNMLEITVAWTQAVIALSLPLAFPWALWRLWQWRISQRSLLED